MLLDPVAVNAKGEPPKWKCSCDWKGCTRVFLSGHKSGKHYCPGEHQKANKQAITKGSLRRLREYGKVAGTSLDRRTNRATPDRAWTDTSPHCPDCLAPISAWQDCNCPKDEVERQWESIWK